MVRQDILAELGAYMFSETYSKGYSCNLYGDVSKITDCLNVYLDELFPVKEELSAENRGLPERTRFCGNMVLAEVQLREELAEVPDVRQRYWFIWQDIVRSVYDALPPEEKEGDLEDYAECLLKSVEEVTESEDSDLDKEDFLNELDSKGIRLVLLFYNFDAVAKIFPPEEMAGGEFFQDLFDKTVKSAESNQSRIVIVSQIESWHYAHHMSRGSSFHSAYPSILYEEETSA